MNSFITLIAIMSLKASVLVGVILVAKKILGNILTPSQHYIIWIMIFFVLSIPRLPQTNISAYNLIDSTHNVSNVLNAEKMFIESIKDEKANSVLFEEKDSNLQEKSQGGVEETQVINTSKNSFDILENWMFILWIFGFSVYAFISVLRMYSSVNMAKKEIEYGNFELEEMLNECRGKLKIKKEVKLVFSNEFGVPCIFGVLRPVIFIPESLRNMDENKLRMIILHELAHFKRNDIVVKVVVLLYQWVYWFNPILILAFQKMKNDMEPACDYMVLKNIEKNERAEYGRALLHVLEKLSVERYPISVGIAESKKELRRRIILIGRYKKKSKLAIINGILVMLLIGCSFASDPNADAQNSGFSDNNNTIVDDMNKKQITEEVAKSIYNNKDKMLGSDGGDALKDYKPYVSTYYFDTKGATLEQNLMDMVGELVYPIKSSKMSRALYIYKDSTGKILDIKIDGFDGTVSDFYRNTEYIVNFYNRKSGIRVDKNMTADEIVGFTGDEVDDFQKKFDTGKPSVIAKNRSGLTEVYYYPVYFEEGIEPMAGIYILSKDSKILNIKVDEPNFLFDRLKEHFGKSIPTGSFLEPEKINVYSEEKKTYGQDDIMYMKLMESFRTSLADEANPLRVDDLNKHIKDIKKGKDAGIELVYPKTMKIMYPDIEGNPITYEFDSIFVTADEYTPMMAFGIKGDYGTAPIYMADKNPLVELIRNKSKIK
ncbi:M56 family metallopeptidase [Tepidibacter hydrothermalis]|uniref:M56 family metallopeptidase n=1 Tax=Tepidibacter hydrothermalis TaxID=3036126 RepID=A0ABY8EK72_9FIRM|nr:M56 family metallopeptidase [Tepidibacter hydrothermalis]WFD11550.1 M56 family metallopeptidase [Tepidibacter hydrothermalis]